MVSPKVKDTAPHRLIVEGRDDMYSILSLTARHGWTWDNPEHYYPYIMDAKGVDEAIRSFPLAVRSSYKRVGIVIDADTNLKGRWDSIRALLSPSGFVLPEDPDPLGTVVGLGERRIGVWIMPDNQNHGKLEDFLGVLIPANDPCWGYAEDAAKEASRLGALFSEVDFIKARIFTWLAWQREPGLPFGTAINAALFSHEQELAQAFVNWMQRLYSQQP